MFSRRSMLSGGLASIAGIAVGQGGPRPRRVLRAAHLTDAHLRPEGNARAEFIRCLDHVQRETRADVIFEGGDLVFDALGQPRESVQAQYDLAARLFRENCRLPVYHCVGNHDIWGWDRPDRDALAGDPKFGKGWWKRFTGNSSTYYSFDRAGWHFVFLDSILPTGRTWIARIDDAQWAWLEADLRAVADGTPICIVSHVPILIGAAQFFGPCEMNQRHWSVSGRMAHIDGRRLKDLLARQPQVNVCLSGHTHLHCRVDYNGVHHVNSGAVSGAWWKGPLQETRPGYTVVDFFSNGHAFSRYVTYG